MELCAQTSTLTTAASAVSVAASSRLDAASGIAAGATPAIAAATGGTPTCRDSIRSRPSGSYSRPATRRQTWRTKLVEQADLEERQALDALPPVDPHAPRADYTPPSGFSPEAIELERLTTVLERCRGIRTHAIGRPRSIRRAAAR